MSHFPPDKLRIKVIALYKKGSTDNPSNYEPISLLSVFSKVFEKLMHRRLYTFLEVIEILDPLRFGFRRKHSTRHTLISMTEHIKNTIDNGNYGCGIFIDLKEAFDTVDHTILKKNLITMRYEASDCNGFNPTSLVGNKLYLSIASHLWNWKSNMVFLRDQY